MKFKKGRLEKPKEDKMLLCMNWPGTIFIAWYVDEIFYDVTNDCEHSNVLYWLYQEDIIPEDCNDEFVRCLNV